MFTAISCSKCRVLAVLLLVLISCSGTKYISSDNIYGQWSGTGTFNNTKIKADIGDVSFQIKINEDNTVSGTIGDAQIIKSRIIRHVTFSGPDGNTLKCKLHGKINSQASTRNKNIKILMYVHNKNLIHTNFYYGGRVGNVTLKKY